MRLKFFVTFLQPIATFRPILSSNYQNGFMQALEGCSVATITEMNDNIYYRIMKKNILGRAFATIAVMLAVTAGMSSCKTNWNSNGGMKGDIEYSQDELKARPFNKISVELPCDVYYTQNDGTTCDVKLDFSGIKDADLVSELKEKIKVVYRHDGEVELGIKGRVRGFDNNGKGNRLKVYITSPDLVELDNEGLGNVYAKSINSDRLKVTNEGVGSIEITSLLANRISLDNEGVGSIKVTHAKGDNLTADNEGVGSISIGNFAGGVVTLDNEGVGSIHIAVDCQSVKADNEGVGSIHLSGKTRTLTQDNEGVGKIHTSGLQVGK